MSFFDLQRWHFDLLTTEDTCILVLATRVSMAGIRDGRISVHLVPSGTEVPTIHRSVKALIDPRASATTLLQTQYGGVSVGPSRAGLALTLPDLSVSLAFASVCPTDFTNAALHIPSRPGFSKTWQPLSLRSTVTGSLVLGGRTRIGIGQSKGYVDFTRSNVLPLHTPVRTRYWARIHAAGMDIAFTCAEGPPGKTKWNRALADVNGKLYVFQQVIVRGADATDAHGCPMRYEVIAISREARLSVHIEHKHLAFDSRLLDASTFGNVATRLLYRILSKSPRGATYVSIARVTFAAGGKEQAVGDVRCIDEVMKYAW